MYAPRARAVSAHALALSLTSPAPAGSVAGPLLGIQWRARPTHREAGTPRVRDRLQHRPRAQQDSVQLRQRAARGGVVGACRPRARCCLARPVLTQCWLLGQGLRDRHDAHPVPLATNVVYSANASNVQTFNLSTPAAEVRRTLAQRRQHAAALTQRCAMTAAAVCSASCAAELGRKGLHLPLPPPRAWQHGVAAKLASACMCVTRAAAAARHSAPHSLRTWSCVCLQQ